MSVQDITTIVGSLGFPIAMCVALLLMYWKRDIMHKEEMEKMSEAINNNTAVMNKLLDKFGE